MSAQTITFHNTSSAMKSAGNSVAAPVLDIFKNAFEFSMVRANTENNEVTGDVATNARPYLSPANLKEIDQDMELLMALIAELEEMMTTEQAETGYASIEADTARRAALAEKMKEQLKLAVDKFNEAEAKKNESTTMGWVSAILGVLGAIVAVVAAVVATGASCGAAGVLIGVAVVGCIMACADIANMACKEEEVKHYHCGEEKSLDFSIGGLVSMAYDQAEYDGTLEVTRQDDNGNYLDRKGNIKVGHVPSKFAISEEDYNKAKEVTAIVVSVVISVAMLLVGGGAGVVAARALKAAAESGKALSRGSAFGERLATAISTGLDMVQASTTIYGSTLSMEVAELQRDSEKSRAEKKKLEVLIKDIAQRINMSQEFVYKLVTALNAFVSGVSDGIKESADCSATISRNCAV